MVERIASAYSGPNVGASDRVLRRELISGQPWAGYLGAVEVDHRKCRDRRPVLCDR
jgi:hypothetical protein